MHQLLTTLGVLLLLMGSIPTALGRMQFLSPPEFSNRRDARRNTVWTIGSPLELRWTPGESGKTLSVMLYQLNASQAAAFDGEFDYTQSDGAEYITRDQINATDFTWFVGTRRDLSLSPMFAIAIWQEGQLVTDSATNIFNITDVNPNPSSTGSATGTKTGTAIETVTLEGVQAGAGPGVTPITSSGSGSGTIEGLSTATATFDGRQTRIPSPAGTTGTGDDTSSSADGLSTSEAIGVGVGATAGVVLLIALGWFLGRRLARQGDNNHGEKGIISPDPSVWNQREMGGSENGYGHGNGNDGYYTGPNSAYYYHTNTASRGPPNELSVEKDPVEALPGVDVQRKVELPVSG